MLRKYHIYLNNIKKHGNFIKDLIYDQNRKKKKKATKLSGYFIFFIYL